MSWIIYHKDTTDLLCDKYNRPNMYATPAAVIAGLTRAYNSGKIKSRKDWFIAEYSDFKANIEKQETKINLMSGQPFTQSVNTPLCCDPSSETYWSM